MTQLPDEHADDDPLEEGEFSVNALSDSFAQLFGQGTCPAPNPSAPDLPTTDADTDDEAAASSDESPVELRVVRAADRDAATEDDDHAVAITPLNVLEAILFVGHPTNEPVTAQQVSNLIRGVETTEVDLLVRQLNERYDELGCPYEVVSVGPGYRLMLRSQFGALRDKFYGKVREARLTQAAIDVLSIVAYEQPIHRKDIEAICQRPAGGILNQLVRRQLLSVERVEDQPREPYYRTTDRFLELFGIQSLDELPRSQSLDRDM